MLYRASHSRGLPYAWTCWSDDPDVARAYTLNVEHGGPRVFRMDVDPMSEKVLDLVSPDCRDHVDPAFADNDLSRFADAVGREFYDALKQIYRLAFDPYPWEIPDEDRELVRLKLASKGYRWIRYADGWPTGAITFVPLQRRAEKTVLHARRPASGSVEARCWLEDLAVKFDTKDSQAWIDIREELGFPELTDHPGAAPASTLKPF
jgi:hypothetical protein